MLIPHACRGRHTGRLVHSLWYRSYLQEPFQDKGTCWSFILLCRSLLHALPSPPDNQSHAVAAGITSLKRTDCAVNMCCDQSFLQVTLKSHRSSTGLSPSACSLLAKLAVHAAGSAEVTPIQPVAFETVKVLTRLLVLASQLQGSLHSEYSSAIRSQKLQCIASMSSIPCVHPF